MNSLLNPLHWGQHHLDPATTPVTPLHQLTEQIAQETPVSTAPIVLPAPASHNFFVVEFHDAEAFLKKVFQHTPAGTAAALAVVNSLAPEAELIFAVVDPPLAAVANPIITEIQADLTTVAAMLKAGNTVSVATFLAAIKANFSTLLTEAHITNPDSVAKANGIVAAIDSLINEFQPAK